jgi:perosamine synthetase
MPKKFMPIAAAFAPNYKLQDLLIASQEFFLPWKWKNWQDGEYITELEKEFAKYMNKPDAISFASGRVGFYAILEALGIQKDDEIILQAFTTVALPNVIKSFGAIPIFVDIEKETFNIDLNKIEERITPNTKAIIIQHTFGNPAEVEEIASIAKKYELSLIEDCAHSLGAEYKGTKTGNFSDAAFFSFGRDKVVSSVSGGMVIAQNKDLAEKIRKIQNKMQFPEKREIAKNLLHPIITMPALFTYNLFSLGKVIMFATTKMKILNRAYSEVEKNGKFDAEGQKKMPNSLARIALNQMSYIEKFNKHRIEIAEYYEKNIKESDFYKQSINFENKNIYLWYTILVNKKRKMIKEAAKSNIILGDWFPQAIGPESVDLEKAGYQKGDCPIAEEISAACINLPTHHNIGKEQADKVIDFINRF